MIKAKLLGLIHMVSVGIGGGGLLLKELQQHSELVPGLLNAFPNAQASVTSLALAVGVVTHLIDRKAKDKIAQAIIDDPKLPTPVGMGIPKVGE